MPLRAVLMLALCLPLAGCYLLESAQGQLELNASRVPIKTVLARPDTPPKLRSWLELATRIRDFASSDLGLPDNRSYRSYADLKRRFVVWNVFAAPEFSVDAKTWCFPVAGCVAYRGYFREALARRFERSLTAQGYDVLVGGVAAYSTLGHFSDPVLNTMLDWDEAQLAGLLFHELGHQLIYVKNDTAFNEAFATVVENEGVRRWLAAEGRSAALDAYLAREAKYAEVVTLLAATRTRLRALYASGLPPAQMRAAKAEEFQHLRAAYEARRDYFGPGYQWLFGADLNNAMLVSVGAYQDCTPGLEARLRAAHGNLAEFYAAVRALAKRPLAERHATVCVAP